VRSDGKPSVTEYTVLERLVNCSLLALRPVTGRTHQLRLHCSHRGFPILGDPQYGSEESKEFSWTLGLPYQMLCAKKLELNHPITGEELILESKMDVRKEKTEA
jgi:23S rRNA-/tRNA-specific pseudouridylate synthase